jgi:hypothetical protein
MVITRPKNSLHPTKLENILSLPRFQGTMPDRHPSMKPMFLPGVENNPQPGSFTNSIRMMQDAGAEYPQIWHLFAYLPQATQHLARFTQEILRGPSPLSPGIRELIAAYTSSRNQCPF